MVAAVGTRHMVFSKDAHFAERGLRGISNVTRTRKRGRRILSFLLASSVKIEMCGAIYKSFTQMEESSALNKAPLIYP